MRIFSKTRLLVFLLIFNFVFLSFPAHAALGSQGRPPELNRQEYWQILNNTYDNYLDKRWDEGTGLYLDENNGEALLRANVAALIFHTMRQASAFQTADDTHRARLLIDNLISDFSYTRRHRQVIRSKGQQRFLIKRDFQPSSLAVYVNNRRQKNKRDYLVKMPTSYSNRKKVQFERPVPKGSKVVFIYKHRQAFRASLRKVYSRSHISFNYQAAEALYFAYKYRAALGLSASQTNSILYVLNTLASYADYYATHSNQFGLAWGSGILRFAYEATGNRKYANKWKKDMSLTLTNLTKAQKNNTADLDIDFTLNYYRQERNPLAWDTQEYSNIVLRALEDIAYFKTKGIRLDKHRNFRLLLGLRQTALGNFMMNGYPNWESGYGRWRQFVSLYWVFTLYSLKTIIATPQFNQRGNDERYARYLLDQALYSFSLMDSFNADPQDGAISTSPFGVKHVVKLWADNNKISANADFMAQTSLLLVDKNLHSVTAAKPANIWHWTNKQQKLAISTPRYSTTLVGNTNGVPNRNNSFMGFPYGGLEMTGLMDSDTMQPLTMIRPGSIPSSFAFIVRDQQRQKTMLNTYNALAGKLNFWQKRKTKPLAMIKTPNGNLKSLRAYHHKRFNLEFDKLKINGNLAFDNGNYSFNNAHVFLNDAVLISEKIRARKKNKRKLVSVSKFFPASSHINQITARSIDKTEPIFIKSTNYSNNLNNVKQLKYLHYQGDGVGLLIAVNKIDWGKGARIVVGSSQHYDLYNQLGVRPVKFIIQSKQKLSKLTFSVILAFTDGTDTDAETKYNLTSQ